MGKRNGVGFNPLAGIFITQDLRGRLSIFRFFDIMMTIPLVLPRGKKDVN